ncbi:MAG TPA: c-type cytochrome [Pirellulaceae bacterium]|nr:c-type cytochrome [Pirellulaceae bacterium]HMO93009.1 c-type cytochrome [Pirellulaceae bacterium]HMP67913.1 c-type cytochrome [Pirellulaceae bacterium]
MKSKVFATAAVAFVIGAILGVVLSPWNAQQSSSASAQPATPAEAPAATWLKGTPDDKLVQVERQLRGFDVTMVEVGYRYDELVDAAKSRNWEYAQYQTEKIEHTIRLGLERRPKRANSAQPFLNDSIPPVIEAIRSRNAEQLDSAVQNLHTGCIQCHRAENVLYMGGRFAAIHPTSEANAKAITDYLRLMTPEFLAAADRSQGRLLYAKHCATCHRFFGEGSTTGPDLTNLQRSNVEYLLKTIIDPNALVGFDYQTVVIATIDGRVISGLVMQEDDNSLTIQTAEKSVTTPKNEIEERSVSSVSAMPEGLLRTLSNEQVRDLLGYLQGSDQAPLPAEKKDEA